MTVIDVRIAVAASVVTCAAGAACGYILTKKRMTDQYELLIEEEVKKAKDYYTEHPPVAPEDHIPEVEVVVTDDERGFDEVVSVDAEDPDEVYLREKHIQYNKIAANYDAPAVQQAARIKPAIGESIEDYENRLIASAKEAVSDTLEQVEPEINIEGDITIVNVFDDNGVSTEDILDKDTRSADHPYIIDYTEFEENDLEYSQNNLVYYSGDNILVDERDQPVNIHQTILETNLKFGVGSGDKNIVFVRNHKLEVDFEIARSTSSYAEEVLGVIPRDRDNKG